ncbi:hypothetical protein Agub_g5083, partial [Astrephomene gubernaculifera]
MVRGGRNGSLPGPSTMPPHPGVEVPYRFDGIHGSPAASGVAHVRSTQTTAQGILRDKSNTSPWITDTHTSSPLSTGPAPPYYDNNQHPYYQADPRRPPQPSRDRMPSDSYQQTRGSGRGGAGPGYGYGAGVEDERYE